MKLEIKNLSAGYNKKIVFKNVNFVLEKGEILNILGKNGVGKSSLFKTILRFINKKEGEIFIGEKNINSLSQKELSKLIAYVPQSHMTAFPFLVKDVILMGRTAHLNIFSSPKKEDILKIEKIMDYLDIRYLENKIYTEISGGERQLCLIARAMAQESKILIMDEPTSNLDFGNQIKVIKIIKKLSDKGISVIVISHFPNHAFLCEGKVAIMKKSDEFIIGNALEIITNESMKNLYGIDIIVKKDYFEDKEINYCLAII